MRVKNSGTKVGRKLTVNRFSLLTLSSLALLGCSNTGGPRSVESLEPSERISVDRMREVVVAESKKLADTQEKLRQALERKAAEEAMIEPEVPKHDPLEDKVVSINMYEADVGRLLWALADQLGMNLIIDPQVLSQQRRASLYLKNVTAREVYDHILQAFDLYGDVRGSTLVVRPMEERIFNVDYLNANTSMDLSAGGNVFGSTGAAGTSNALKGNFSLAGNNGKQTDPYEQLENALKSILGDVSDKKSSGQTQAANDENKPVADAPAYSLNRITGSLYVKGKPSQVKTVARFLERSQTVLGRQVQVEAQLIDVSLNDGFSLGVDWNLLRKHVAGIYGSSPATVASASAIIPSTGTALAGRTITMPSQTIGSSSGTSGGLMYSDDNFSVAISALRSFGNVRVLSNPSVRVRNGSPALLTVGTSSRYVVKSSVTTSNSGGGATTTSSDVQTDSLFGGIVVGVVPFIHDDGRIELLVHPMQTEVDSTSMALVDVGGGSKVTLPVVNYKGITTTLNLKNGDTVMIGGLIDQNSGKSNKGLPGVSDIPGLGKMFDNESSSQSSRELVVVLRATLQ